MKPSEVRLALGTCINAGVSAILWGPPAVGKTSVVEQLAADERATDSTFGLLEMRLGFFDPVDLMGVPAVVDGRTFFATPAMFPTTGRGIIFLDELPQAERSLMAKGGMLLHERRLGDWTCPAGWSIIAAGNRSTDNAAANKMPSNLGSRVCHLDFEIDQDDWTRHALGAGFRTEVVAFLRFRPELLHKYDSTKDRDARTFPSPRTWQYVSRLLDAKPDPAVEMALYAGCVGEGAAAEFTGFLRVFRTLPSPDAILMNPGTADVPTDPATLYAICGALARKATDQNIPAIVTYAGRMSADFGVCLIADSARRCPAVQQTRAFVQWASDNSDVQI